jgi:ribose transport system permease protein
MSTNSISSSESPIEKKIRHRSDRVPFNFASLRKELGIFGLLLVVCIITGIKNPAFLGEDNLQNLARLVGIYGIFSIGAGIVIITGGIDLSVGSIFALEGVVLALALNDWHWNPAVAILGVIALTMFLGLIHGFLITKVPLQPFIVTLCGLMIYRGLARYVSGDSTEGFGDGTGYVGLMNLATGTFQLPTFHLHLGAVNMAVTPFGIPNPFIVMVVIAVVMWIVVHRSIYGRYLFAVGRNEEAAKYSGIKSGQIIASAYIVAALLAAIAGILLAFYTNSISPSSHGQSYELYGIAAAVLGGCSLRGGEGSVIGVLIGTTLLQVLQNLVNLLGIPSSLNFAVVGTVILIGVIADEIVKKRSAKKAVAK